MKDNCTETSAELLERIVERALDGTAATVDEAMLLADSCPTDALCDAADRIRRHFDGNRVDTCSIVNARSGRCSEDCKWCAQSGRHHTGIDEYEFIPEEEAVAAALDNDRRGVRRFSMVTSGRKVSAPHLDRFCSMFRKISEKSDIKLCASMGLLSADELRRLKEAGVSRYHCNLETAASLFPTLCSTHTHADKLRTIAAAREAGLEVCSGGIIGMGETLRQRLELAAEACQAGAVSIPVNILCPIKGTALENTPPIAEEEIVRSVALMKLVAPKATLRFAGGRARLSRQATARLLQGGISGSIVGDLLTTVGNGIDADFALYDELKLTH